MRERRPLQRLVVDQVLAQVRLVGGGIVELPERKAVDQVQDQVAQRWQRPSTEGELEHVHCRERQQRKQRHEPRQQCEAHPTRPARPTADPPAQAPIRLYQSRIHDGPDQAEHDVQHDRQRGRAAAERHHVVVRELPQPAADDVSVGIGGAVGSDKGDHQSRRRGADGHEPGDDRVREPVSAN